VGLKCYSLNILGEARWPRGQHALRTIAEAKQHCRSSDGWPKLYCLELLRASEGTLRRWSRLHLQSLAPTNPHWAPVVGSCPVLLMVIHEKGLCPSSGVINRIMMMMKHLRVGRIYSAVINFVASDYNIFISMLYCMGNQFGWVCFALCFHTRPFGSFAIDGINYDVQKFLYTFVSKAV
jgi:hypothetical protein